MERTNPLQLPAYDKPLLLCALQKAGEAIRIWRSRRRTAKLVRQLSPDRALDCGIECGECNKPSLEVPTGLIQELMSMR